MAADAAISLFNDDDLTAPAGHPQRFGGRWRLVGAGLSNVWRYGDLILDANSGRLLLRGPNGTGKTTALEALWPYLLDLNAQRLAAGKARPTSLASLMREGATGKNRYGYVWMTLAGPGEEGTWSFGARLQYSEGGSPSVRVVPFTIPGIPVRDLDLYGTGRGPLMLEQFTDAVEAAGGEIFVDEDAYVTHLAARLWGTTDRGLRDLATRLRAVRNPTLLGDVSAKAAAEALREALPGVSDDVVSATADALAESDETRKAFTRDRESADALTAFAGVWSGHVVDVVTAAHRGAAEAATHVTRAHKEHTRLESELTGAMQAEKVARDAARTLKEDLAKLAARIQVLENDEAFRAAGTLRGLQQTLTAQTKQAAAAAGQMSQAAQAACDRGRTLRQTAADINVDLADTLATAVAADPQATVDVPLLTWGSRPRGVYTAGDVTADPGPGLTVDVNLEVLAATVDRWGSVAAAHTTRAADAQLALTDFKPVQKAAGDAAEAVKDARVARGKADVSAQKADQVARDAATAAGELLDQVADWTERNPDLAANERVAGGETPTGESDASQAEFDFDFDDHGWGTGDIDEIRSAEPGQIIGEVDRWARHVQHTAAGIVAALRQRRQQAADEAGRLRTAAGDLRARAADLRAGKLLELPRPDWAGPGDDATAFGAALDWHPDVTDPTQRALIETALAASGLLGATIADGGANTGAWQVTPAGTPADDNLSAVVTVDPAHPHAAVAQAVLQRIQLTGSATDTRTGDSGALVIGRDGTFRAGPLHGRAPGADDVAVLPAAAHVGARQRRAAALAHAAELDRQAAELDRQAGQFDQVMHDLAAEVTGVQQRAAKFPSRDHARGEENRRVLAATHADEQDDAARAAEQAAYQLGETAAQLRLEWEQRTTARRLPLDVSELERLHKHGQQAAAALQAAAEALAGKQRTRLERLVADVADDVRQTNQLSTLHTDAVIAVAAVVKTFEQVDYLRRTVGQKPEQAVAEHAEVTAEHDTLSAEQDGVQERVVAASSKVTELKGKLETAAGTLARAQPHANALQQALRVLVDVPGVTDVLFAAGTRPAAGESGSADGGGDIIAMVGNALAGKRAVGRKALRDGYDDARTALGRAWSLDPGDTVGNLDQFVLTYDGVAYSPPAAAVRGQQLKDRAQAALAAAEESALRDFVIGRLPSAIGTAWVRMTDWIGEVNRKMRSAAASSGVGVQVRIRLSDDLPAATRTVYNLSCQLADADRTPAQKAEVGDALQSLIAAADGNTMADKLAAAVDIRQWIDVHYEVTRPDGGTQRWSSKTGLSGGERRLVVLAPMLASVAAGYDSLGMTGLRLAPLDEVPAEVDERGREGLARYIADLDLDLICTSYLWDGAPGAWDGVDAWDLEAGPDGTVVAFPMLVRGMLPLPGDIGAGTGIEW